MKLTIELEELKLEAKDVYLPESYEEDKIYLVNDGVVWMLANKLNDAVATIILPNKMVLNQYIKQNKEELVKDYRTSLDSKLKTIQILLKEALENSQSVKKSDTSIDLNDISKLVAVAQKPELYKEK